MAILADDLIWATRLADLVQGADAVAVPVRTWVAFEAALAGVDRVIVDMTSRAYDGIQAIAMATAARRPVIAVGQHDDHQSRKAARDAGASQVYAYRRLFEDGQRQIGSWLAAQPLESAR